MISYKKKSYFNCLLMVVRMLNLEVIVRFIKCHYKKILIVPGVDRDKN